MKEVVKRVEDYKVFNSTRKLIVLNDGEYMFLVDIVQTGKEKFMSRGYDQDKGIQTDWVSYEGINPEDNFVSYVKHLINSKTN